VQTYLLRATTFSLNSPQTLPPKGMIELDSVVRTTPYESALPALFL